MCLLMQTPASNLPNTGEKGKKMEEVVEGGGGLYKAHNLNEPLWKPSWNHFKSQQISTLQLHILNIVQR